MTARPRVRAGLVLGLVVALAVVVAMVQPTVRTKLTIGWLARGLDSTDPMARTNARQRLLDLGRPAIDGVYPHLIASEVADELQGTGAWAVVAKPSTSTSTVKRSSPGERAIVVEERLGGSNVTPTTDLVTDALVCPVAQRLSRRGAKRELLVLAYPVRGVGGDALETISWLPLPEVRVAVPLDDELAPEVIEAVRQRLARPLPTSPGN